MTLQVVVPDQIWTVADFLSPEECASCIDLTEKVGYGDAPITTATGYVMRPDIRNNTRVMVDDTVLADTLWQSIAPFVPTPLGDHTAIGLNERFRFYRYDVGQTFRSHLDGSFSTPQR